ncbi:MAG: glutamate racemase, partial [Chlamydiota bacterium]
MSKPATECSKRPIGLFDSGFGGLTVMREVARLLPRENLIYLGDTAHLPYGNKSPDSIYRYAFENAAFLLEKNIKLLIIPCHTACTHALSALQKQLPIPVIGVIESGVELIFETTSSFRIAVLGTSSTIASGIYPALIRSRFPNAHVYPVACPLFVPLVEEGFFNHKAAELVAESYLNPLKQQQIDTALLACTHYPLLRPIIQKTLGNQV